MRALSEIVLHVGESYMKNVSVAHLSLLILVGNSPGMMAPIKTLVACPPQKAWIPNQMHDTNTLRMTGTFHCRRLE